MHIFYWLCKMLQGRLALGKTPRLEINSASLLSTWAIYVTFLIATQDCAPADEKLLGFRIRSVSINRCSKSRFEALGGLAIFPSEYVLIQTGQLYGQVLPNNIVHSVSFYSCQMEEPN